MRPSLSLCLALAAVLCSCNSTHAQLDPEAKTPYQVRVVLSVAEHRMLTPAFQAQLEREVQAQVQLAFGKMANVTLVRGHPLLGDIRTRGLQPVLDAWNELSDWETVFVLIDFVDGRYTMEVGEHDGQTGLSSPVVRHESLAAPQRLAATVAQMIHDDFGVVGTVMEVDAKGLVRVALKGGALSNALPAWIKKGDVFVVARIAQEGANLRATRIEWAVLQTVEEPQNGAVLCKYFHRYLEDRLVAAPPVVGFRCVKLATARGPVRLRLIDSRTQEPLSGLEVHVSTTGAFKGKPQGATVDGLFKSSASYDRVAYVRVLSGGTPLIEFPVEIVDDRVVVVRMSPDAKAIARGQVELRRDRWVLWLYEARAVADRSIQELNAVIGSDTIEKALDLARRSLKSLADEVGRLRNEQIELLQLAVKLAPGLEISEGEPILKELAQRQDELQKFVDRVELKLKEKNSTETLKLEAKLQKASLLESQADFDKAIDVYRDVLKAQASASVEAHLKELEAAWAIKSAAHAQARDFIYTTWPKLDLAGVKTDLGKAKEMFERCQKAGDTKTPLKLLQANKQYAGAINKRIDVLKRAPDTEDNRLELKGLVQLGLELRGLQNQVTAWLAKEKKG